MTQLRNLLTEMHRRSIWQVLGVYALASWAIWQVVGSLYEWIGLPDWVPGTALVLLLIGLPIVLATAFVQEGAPTLQRDDRRATVAGLETTQETVAGTGHGEEPGQATESSSRRYPASAGPNANATTKTKARRGTLFTWSKAVTGGVLAFAALGVAASGFMGMRAMGIGPAATLISSGELGRGTQVLVADFESPPGDSLTAIALAEALRIDLGQSQSLRVVDPAEIGPALARMQREPGTPLDEDVARELAIREGIPVVLLGDLVPVGTSYQITARLIRPDSSRILLRVRERATGQEDLLLAMDRLTERLLERTGESLKSLRATGPLAAYTTSSLDALKLYSQGQRAASADNDDRRAEELLSAAIQEDSTFAMAWRKLGAARINAGDRTGAVEAFTRAYQLSDRLPEAERLYAAASYHTYVEYDLEKVAAAYERLLEITPDGWGALNNLGLNYQRLGESERALEVTARAVAMDSNATSMGNLALYAVAAGDLDRAMRTLEERRRLYPANIMNDDILRGILYARGETDAVRENIERVLDDDTRTDPRRTALWDRSMIEVLEGRLAAAERTLDEHRSVLEQTDRPTGESLLNLAFYDVFVAGDTSRAHRRLERFTRQIFPTIPELDRPYLPVASAYALIGDLGAAHSMIESWERAVPAGLRRRAEDDRLWATGMVALAEGREEEALDLLRRSTERTSAAYINRFFLAWAYDMTGRADSAIVAYHRYMETPHWNRLFVDAVGLPLTYERLGMLHEDRGERAEAAEYYARFVELWTDADAELQPRVESARRALARLAGERI